MQKVKSMGYSWRTYSLDDEFLDLYVSLGVDGTKFKEDHMNLVETIKGLWKYVQSYNVDNESLMRSKE